MQNLTNIHNSALKVKLLQLNQQKVLLQKLRENKAKQVQIKNIQQQKLQQQKLQQQKLQEQKLQQQKLQQKMEQQKMAQQKLQQKMAQQKLQQQKLQEQKLQQQKMEQQKMEHEQNKIEITNFINLKTITKNNYNNLTNNKQYLLIMATHCDSDIKFSTIKNNVKYLKYDLLDIVIINSTGLKYNNELNKYCDESKIVYKEIPNDGMYDFGKFLYDLQNTVNSKPYDYVIFTNDSYIIHSSISHFLNFISNTDVEFYGYNDSMEQKYHIQTYLFALKTAAIPNFIKNMEEKKQFIKNQEDVIANYELEMTNWFHSHACFLDITTLRCQQKISNSNIFFHNNDLYIALKEKELLPFTKLKRLNNKHYPEITNVSCYL